jgi:hypothetical protein
MKAIAFCGLTKSGKDTAALPLISNNYQRLGFADKVKEIVAELYNVPLIWMHDPVLKETACKELFGRTPRQVLQPIATEAFRDMVAQNTWINYVFFQMQRIHYSYTEVAQKPTNITIIDVRFPNEAEMLRSIGATIIHIVDPHAPPPQNHSSENQVALVGKEYADHTIINDRKRVSIAALHNVVRNIEMSAKPVTLNNYDPYVGIEAESALENAIYKTLVEYA